MAVSALPPFSPPTLQVVRAADGGVRVELAGYWNLRGLRGGLARFREELARFGEDPEVQWDLSRIEMLDNAGAAILWRAWGRRLSGRQSMRPEHAAMFAHLSPREEAVTDAPAWSPRLAVVALGRQALWYLHHLRAIVTLMGRVVLDLAYVVREPARIPWKEISANVHRAGAEALGITGLVAFLIGVTLAYLSATQLRMFGADAFILNLLGISVIRELGPMLAAILVAGRSGSAMTAQLGVMRVTEELDAMSVMGIPYTIRLVLPKIVALAIVLPLLTLWTNAIAMIGGMICSQIELGISFQYFLSALPRAVPIANVWIGIGKAVVFGMLIALIACHFGLRIQPDTESLGAGTTSSVVTSITIVILVDAVFAVAFKDVGLQFL